TTLLLLVCIVVNYLAGLRLEPRPDRDARNRKLLLAATVAVNLTILFIWKYAGFATAQIAVLASWFGIDDYPVLELVLPIGISFYTFHHISYVVDIYRGERPALRNPVSFVTYIAMFPQLVAGPIVRYREVAHQLPQLRTHRWSTRASPRPRRT